MDGNSFRSLIENPSFTRKKITLQNGRILSYSECGNVESGMPVLFCYGLMTSSIAVVFSHDAAIHHNFRMISVDYPGVGESSTRKESPLSGWCDDVTEFCDNVLGEGTTVRILGHSLGALYALALLSHQIFRHRVSRTTLVAPWVCFEGNESENPMWLSLTRKLPETLQSSVIPAVINQLSTGFISLAGWSNPQELQLQMAKLVTDYSRLQGNGGNEQMIRLAISDHPKLLPSNLQVPIIVYYGKNDHLVLKESVVELVKSLNNRGCTATLILVSGGGHNSILGEASCLNSVMTSLLDATGDRSSSIGNSRSMRAKALSIPRKKVMSPLSKQAKVQNQTGGCRQDMYEI